MTTPPTAAEPAAQTATESEQKAYIDELFRLEQDGERCPVTIGPYSLLLTITALQLALRHPGMGGNVHTVLLRQIQDWRGPFAGTLGAWLIDRGFDPANDVTVTPHAAPAGPPAMLECTQCGAQYGAPAGTAGETCSLCGGQVLPQPGEKD